MYSTADAAKRVRVTDNAGSYSVAQGVDRQPEIASVPSLNTVATLSQDGRKADIVLREIAA
jgi:hypothetical protein